MISFKALPSASSTAEYFSKDNYYTLGQAQELSAWSGRAAEDLGLAGRVDEKVFAALLEGRLPNGGQIAASQGKHRAGVDITFAASKSVSLLALIGGDERIVTAMRESVQAALVWAEANVMEARVWDPALGEQVPEKTGNLVAATFLHDVSRNNDPQLHVHAIVANATKASDGKWHAMTNKAFYEAQHIISAVQNAELRTRIEALGYETVPARNPIDGAFEVKGVSREVVEAFSSRRLEILDALAKSGRGSAAERQIVTLNTRKDKDLTLDPEQRNLGWLETARSLDFDPAPLIDQARERAGRDQTIWSRVAEGIRGIGAKGMAIAATMGITPKDGDPLVPERLGRLDPISYAAAQAVASAARELGENEAAFSRHDLIRTALERQGPFTVSHIETRIDLLVRGGQLIGGERMLTTEQAVAMESRVIDLAQAGKGAVAPIATGVEVGARLQAAARELGLHRLNPGQEQAGVAILTSRDRVHLIQGGAGVGKSAALAPVAAIARAEGHNVIALAHVGRMAREFGGKVNAPASTVDGFLRKYARVLDGTAYPAKMEAARKELTGTLVLVDEASQVGTDRFARLIELANKMEVAGLVFAGDKGQLPAIERGRPFADLQREDLAKSAITENLRAKTPQMQAINKAIEEGDIAGAFEALRPTTSEVPLGKAAETAATMWANLPRDEREQTVLLASGRAMRTAGNAAAQRALLAKGELGAAKASLKVLDRITITKEGARQLKGYQYGGLVEFTTNLPKTGFARGEIGEVVNVADGKVELVMEGGEVRSFDPSRLPRNLKHDAVTIYEQKQITIHEGDRIRWTAKDEARELYNGDMAHVKRIDGDGITVRTASGHEHQLFGNDPMRDRFDLAYAINVHIAQGITAKAGIVMMSSLERLLNSSRAFVVAATRIAETIHLVVDDPNKVEKQVERNPGDKTSAREVTMPTSETDKKAEKKDFEKERDYAKELTKHLGIDKMTEARSRDWDMGL